MEKGPSFNERIYREKLSVASVFLNIILLMGGGCMWRLCSGEGEGRALCLCGRLVEYRRPPGL